MRKIIQEGAEIEDDKGHQSWRWGELPSLSVESTHSLHRNSLSSSATTNQPNSMNTILLFLFSHV